MGVPTEAQIQEQQSLKRAREEAAIRETAGANKMINIFRGICWAGAIIPILGVFIVALSFIIGLFGSVYLILKQNIGGGIKQLIFTFIGGFVALGVWFVVNIAVIGFFG